MSGFLPWLFFLWLFGSRALLVLALILLLFWLTPRVTALQRRWRFMRDQQTSKLNPHDFNARYQLGLLYLDGRLYGRARRELEEALAIYDESANAHAAHGRACLLLKDYAAARTSLTRALELNPQHGYGETHLALGRTCAGQQDAAAARDWYEKSTRRNGSLAEPHVRLGRLALHDGNRDAARRHFRDAIAAAAVSGRQHRYANLRWAWFARWQLLWT